MLILILIIIIFLIIAFAPTRPIYTCETCGKKLIIRLDDKILIYLKNGRLKRLAYLECEDYLDEPHSKHTHITLKLKGL